MAEIAVDVWRVVKRYGQFLALDAVSVSAKDNEVFTLLGASGYGKTTLLRMIAGLEDVTKGDIYLFGEEIAKGGMSGFGPHQVACDGDAPEGAKVHLSVRPERVTLSTQGFPGVVRENIFVGTDVTTLVALKDGTETTVRASNSTRDAVRIFDPGAEVGVAFERLPPGCWSTDGWRGRVERARRRRNICACASLVFAARLGSSGTVRFGANIHHVGSFFLNKRVPRRRNLGIHFCRL